MYGIQLKNLSKEFSSLFGTKRLMAVENIDLEIRKGEILGLLGPNGAGKSTIIKMACGLLRPTSGEIIINGLRLGNNRSRILTHIGAVLEGSRNSLWSMTVKQNLTYFGYLKNVHGKVLKERSDELLFLFQLEHKKDEPVKNLSKGMRQKLAIVLAFINDPDLILLDEPTLGLDVQANGLVKKRVVQLAKQNNKAVLLSTHNLGIAEEICDRVAVINKGRLIAFDKTERLLSSVSREHYIIKLKGRPDVAALKRLPWVGDVEIVHSNVEGDESLIRLVMDREDSLFEVIDFLMSDGVKILSMRKSEPNLEDIFVRMVED